MTPANIPRELRELAGWVLRRGKVPHYPNGRKRSGTQGSAEDRAQLGTFDEAVAALEKGGDKYDGLGFAMLPDAGFVGIDLDHCIGASGELSATAREFLRIAGETYVERSPSGSGLHIWARGQSSDRKNKSAGVEVFCAKGYLTMTGTPFNGSGTEIKPLTEEMRALLQKHFKREAPPPSDKPPNDDLIEDLASALPYLDADDRELWIKVSLAVGRDTRQSPVAFEIVLAWAAKSLKHKPSIDRKHMEKEFFQNSRKDHKNPVTTKSIFKLARKAGWRGREKPTDADHYRLALAVREALTQETGEPPVYNAGSIWIVDENSIWRAKTVDNLAMIAAKMFAGYKYCKRASDFKAIAQVAASLCEDPTFFERAAVGLAAPGGFWRVTASGQIVNEPLTAAHRQRMRVAADPDPQARCVDFLRVLREAFKGHEPEAQTKLLQQCFGCAITRSLWLHRIAVLLLGATSAGKSLVLAVLRSAFPSDQVSATSPSKWGSEYYVAALAGMALNIVGDMDPKDPIPAGPFKSIIGRDIVEGRHPTHRPFSFVCQAAHFFNCNATPPTSDHSDAFFRRIRIIYFANSIPPEREKRDLDEQIVANELGAFLWWALNGAAEVARAGSIVETATHRRKLSEWRVGNNSALAFILDAAECICDKDASTPGQIAYDVYRLWAGVNGFRPLGRNGFYDSLTAGARYEGVTVGKRGNQVVVQGLRVINAWKVDGAGKAKGV